MTITDTSVIPNTSRTWTNSYDSYGRLLTSDGPRTDVSDVTTLQFTLDTTAPTITISSPARGQTFTTNFTVSGTVLDALSGVSTLEAAVDNGAMVSATSHVRDRLQAEMEIVFAHLADDGRTRTLFEPKNFVFTMKLLGVFDVGRSSDGTKLKEPPGLAKLRSGNAEG